jgi:DNA-binding transcriptional MerR regulator
MAKTKQIWSGCARTSLDCDPRLLTVPLFTAEDEDNIMASEALYEIAELAEQAGTTVRTIRYYLQRGLLPSPVGTGPGARYGTGHLARLRLIRGLQREHLPLAEIRRRIAGLDDAEVEALVEPQGALAQADSAVEYVRALLSPQPAYPHRARVPAPPATRRPPRERSQWERIPLSDDVEVHVRRPLSRVDNRRVDRLLEEARRVFGREP